MFCFALKSPCDAIDVPSKWRLEGFHMLPWNANKYISFCFKALRWTSPRAQLCERSRQVRVGVPLLLGGASAAGSFHRGRAAHVSDRASKHNRATFYFSSFILRFPSSPDVDLASLFNHTMAVLRLQSAAGLLLFRREWSLVFIAQACMMGSKALE